MATPVGELDVPEIDAFGVGRIEGLAKLREASTSLRVTRSNALLGISMPTNGSPGIGASMRMDRAERHHVRRHVAGLLPKLSDRAVDGRLPVHVENARRDLEHLRADRLPELADQHDIVQLQLAQDSGCSLQRHHSSIRQSHAY